MRKLKIMILSLALFTVIGGALAFKAKFIKERMCYTVTNILFYTCIMDYGEFNHTNQGIRYTYYTTTPNFSFEELDFVCYTWDEENPEITITLSCPITATLTTAEF